MNEKDKETEVSVVERLREIITEVLRRRGNWVDNEEAIKVAITVALHTIGRFYRSPENTAYFFRNSDRRLYQIASDPQTPFGLLVTYLSGISTKMVKMGRCLDRIRAEVAYTAEVVTVHALSYNDADAKVIAINDFGGGMWRRERGGTWEWKANGTDGILFWTPGAHVEAWHPEFPADGAVEEDPLDWVTMQPHFGEDMLTVEDQRMLLKALFLAPLFPSQNKVRPVPVHLGGTKGRTYDTGKTMTGKMIGTVWVGSEFQPTPIRRASGRGEEDLQLTLMSQPYVLLDNVDTDTGWLNDFIAVYATGGRAVKRMLYHDTEVVYIELRGYLAITSRDPHFKREDVASRLLPLKFRPIEDDERKDEAELLTPVLKNRGKIWGSLLTLAAQIQDSLLDHNPPTMPGRIADFISFGWQMARVQGQETQWEAMSRRLAVAQAGFALDGEPLFEILKQLLRQGDIPEQKTSDFWDQVFELNRSLDMELPGNAAACTKALKQLKELIEKRLDVTINIRKLDGYSLIAITRGPSWDKEEVREVGEI